tara:strand:- start:92 stop:670 length:579 start_codon:yes stop_codon:yes gene_type:complete
MFRLRPKRPVQTPLGDLVCCKVDLGGRTEDEILYYANSQPFTSITTTQNDDGTWTTEWVSPAHELHGNNGGVIGFTICCGDYLKIDWEDTDYGAPYNNTDFHIISLHDKSVTDPDAYGQEEHYYAYPPDAASSPPFWIGSNLVHEEWTTRMPPYGFDLYPESAFPITACGMSVWIRWEGGVTFSITHGKTPA